jgi:chromosome partitioning protein
MKTIVIANQKGGSGKSTSTVHLAVAAEQADDGPVVISDTDPQGSTVDWFNQRKKAGIDTPRYAPLPLSELTGYLQSLQAAGASYLFIDTAPSIGGVNPDLFAVADLILIPLLPPVPRAASPAPGLLARDWLRATGR